VEGKPPAAVVRSAHSRDGLAPFGMALVLAAGSAVFGGEPTISPRALAKPKIWRDCTELPKLVMLIACGASKKGVIT